LVGSLGDPLPRPRKITEWLLDLPETLLAEAKALSGADDVDDADGEGTGAVGAGGAGNVGDAGDAGVGARTGNQAGRGEDEDEGEDMAITAAQFVDMMCSESICFQGECFSRKAEADMKEDKEKKKKAAMMDKDPEEEGGVMSMVPDFLKPYSLRSGGGDDYADAVGEGGRRGRISRPFREDAEAVFEAADRFDGARPNRAFKVGSKGLGYYEDLNDPDAPNPAEEGAALVA
jgi:hypothetical protein